MCRHLGYLGPPAPVGEILTRGDHSLRTQAWAPKDMRRGGTINADGFGVAWWTPGVPPVGPGVGTDIGGAASDGVGGGDGAETDAGGAASDGVDAGAGVVANAGVGVGGVDGNIGADDRSGVAPVGGGDGVGAEQVGGRGPITLRASRYRNPAPIWTDPAVDEVLPQLRSTAVLGAVRSATVGMPVERSACAPFIDARWAFSHNGVIPEWRTVLPAVAARFGAPDLLTAESVTDSAALWVIVRAALAGCEGTAGARDRAAGTTTGFAGPAGRDPLPNDAEGMPSDVERPTAAHTGDVSPGEVAAVLAEVVDAILVRAPAARLNLLLGDGETLWATTVYHSLSVLVTDDFAVVSSEPYDDDPRWRPIADGQVLTVRPGHLVVAPLASNHPGSAGPDVSERARS